MALKKVPGGWSVRFRYGKDMRGRFRMPDLSPDPEKNEALAKERARRLKRMTEALAASGKHAEAATVLKEGAEALTQEAFSGIERAAREIAASTGTVVALPKQATFRDVCDMMLSGELARRFPDRAGSTLPATIETYRAPLVRFCEAVGSIPIAKLTVDDAERALASLPEDMASSTRARYAGMFARIMNIAAFPLRLIERSPLPDGWRPSTGPRRVSPFLYPDEDACLMRCMLRLGLVDRGLLYGLLAREGLRISEAFGLVWADLDLERGVLRLDKNKTGRPRRWKLRDDVARALRAHHRSIKPSSSDRVFRPGFSMVHSASTFRTDLARCDIKRSDLHEDTKERRHIRIHDLRGTFVTLAMAGGKSEAWIMDRTGHTTSSMLNRYRSQARHAAEIDIGELGPLDELLGMGQARASDIEKPEKTGLHAKLFTEDSLPKIEPDRLKNSQVTEPELGSKQGGPTSLGQTHDPVDMALAFALESATKAERWDVVLAVTAELRERRLARSAPDVSSFDAAKRRRDEGGGK